MGTNNNKKTQTSGGTAQRRVGGRSSAADTDIYKPSGNDPRGRVQNRILDESERYRGQHDPLTEQMAFNYGRGSETDFANYGDIMDRYRGLAGGGGGITPRTIGYTDPFKSYGGYEEFSKTGGYSPEDIANMRSRGISPIRAAYANAEREISRQRSLQGGYSPNATASLGRMAREQSQGMADATQNVEAGLAEARNKGRLSGLEGMRGIEGSRLNADLDVGMFNANAGMRADEGNRLNQLQALQGMTSLYGTTPGMAGKFGDQVGLEVERGGRMGQGYIDAEDSAQKLPGRYEKTKDYITDISSMAYPFIDKFDQYLKRRKTLGSRPTALPSGMMPASRIR